MRKLYTGLLSLFCVVFGISIGWGGYILSISSDEIPTCGMNFHYRHWSRKEAAPDYTMNLNLIISSERVLINGLLEQNGEYAKVNRIVNFSAPLTYPGGTVGISSIIRQRDDEIAEGGKFDPGIIKDGKITIHFSKELNKNYMVDINNYRLGVCHEIKM
jgi:hypothetical protein